jgi:hypothetical protein
MLFRSLPGGDPVPGGEGTFFGIVGSVPSADSNGAGDVA